MNKEQIKEKIIEAIKSDPYRDDIKKVSLFGSYAYGNPGPDSDIDLLVEFEPKSIVGFFKLARIKRHFMTYIDKEIDLVTPSALSIYFKDTVIKNAEPIYERR